jgi:CubicO group peptidase (beta-lactamase class C family)
MDGLAREVRWAGRSGRSKAVSQSETSARRLFGWTTRPRYFAVLVTILALVAVLVRVPSPDSSTTPAETVLAPAAAELVGQAGRQEAITAQIGDLITESSEVAPPPSFVIVNPPASDFPPVSDFVERGPTAEQLQEVLRLPEAISAPVAISKPAGLPTKVLSESAAVPLGKIDSLIKNGIASGDFPGAVVLVGQNGNILKHSAYGNAVIRDPNGQPLAQPIAAKPETIFDLASVTKLFTAVAVMQLVERGAIDLDAPVQRYLPEFSGQLKSKVTVRHLLTHTSGLPPGPAGPRPLFRAGNTREERLIHALKTPMKGDPGGSVVYSDVNFIALGAMIERVSGQTQDEFLKAHLLGPLGMNDTGYRPDKSLLPRTAATSLVPITGKLRPGLVHGVVHDDDAWSLDGIAGHAGLFSTADDLARFSQMIVDGGTYGGVTILKPETLNQMTRAHASSNFGRRGLGFEINQRWYMGDLAGPRTIGHTGYSGTSLVIDLERRAFTILLTNRLHPADRNTNLATYRSGIGEFTASALKSS